MRSLILVFAMAGLATAAHAQTASQFGLQCQGQRLSIDLTKKQWCEVGDDGACPVQAIIKVTPGEILLKDYVKDNSLERREDTHVVWRLNRSAGTLEQPPFFNTPCKKVAFVAADKAKF